MNDFSAAIVAAYDRMPLWRRDQFDAGLRDTISAIERICAWMAEHGDELAALTAEEDE